jgi:hypothetical protein
MADGGLDVGKSAGNLAGDIAGPERDRVELGGLLLEHHAEIGVGLVDETDGGSDLLQRRSRALDGLLDVLNLKGDVLGRLRGLPRELLHSARHHGEALAGIAGAHRLDARVQRQERGLSRHRLDERHHFADASGSLRQPLHRLVGRGEIGSRAAARLTRGADVAGGAPDAAQNSARGDRDLGDVLRGDPRCV